MPVTLRRLGVFKRIVIVLLALGLARPGFSAVTAGTPSAVQEDIDYNEPTTISWTHDCSGNSALVVVGNSWEDAGSGVASVTSSLDGAFTRTASAGTPGGMESFIYVLASPSDGTHTITIAFVYGDYYLVTPYVFSVALTGGDATTPVEDTFSTTGNDGAVSSGALTTSAGSLTIDALMTAATQPTIGAGQTAFTNGSILSSSYEAESTGMSWTDYSGFWEYCGVTFKAASGEPEPEPDPTVTPQYGCGVGGPSSGIDDCLSDFSIK